MSSAPWSLHLLAEVLSAFSVNSPTPLRDVVSRVAEAVDAEITAILRRGAFALCTGLTAAEQPLLQALAEARADTLSVGGITYHLFWAPLGPDDLLVVGRANEPYGLEERALLRGMGRSIQLSTQVLDAVRAEQEALKAEKLAKEAAIREATIDYLTGLANRRLLLRHLTELLGRGDPPQGRIAVLFIDLDRFKQINDIHGHKAGDQVLRMVASHLRALARESDMVGRISGDEFLMIVTLRGAEDAERLALRILERLQEPIQSQGIPMPSAASIGIAMAEPGDTPDTLLDNADLAMYAAKQQGRGRFAHYHRSLRERLEERHRLQEELRLGLSCGQLRAWFQPIVSSVHGGVVGFEALARWHHPQRGLLLPDRFIDRAEEAGLLREMDAAVMTDACHQISRWGTSLSGMTPRLSINISATSLADPELKQRVDRILRESDFPARHLFLEITETTLVEDIASASENINALKAMGIRLAIDDFGTGYSSLSYLKRFPVGILKIDRSFIDGLGTSSEDDIIVETVIQMACSLGLEVVAEGVEHERQALWLRSCGCHYLQGYRYGAAADNAISEQRYRDSLNEQLGLALPSG
jgi:diguanylate cyclase (GGDEF)-like protein